MVSIPAPLKPLIIPIFIPHQGCPHRCIFCNQRAITAEKERMPGTADLEARVEAYLSYAGHGRGPAQAAFYGGNFLGLEREAVTTLMDRLRPWLQSGHLTSIRFSTRPDTITPQRLRWIAPYPVDTIELGVQSMNDTVLSRSRRGHTAADTRQAVATLKAAGYQTGIQLMLGLPGDSAAGARKTGRTVIELKPNFVRIYPTLVMAGSPLAAAFGAGRYTPLPLDEAVAQAKALVRRFHPAQIPVIRMGLQAADGLDDPAVVLAGPYHPAFGHMVYASLYRDAAEALLADAAPLPDAPVLRAHPRALSRLQGLNKANLSFLRERFNRPGVCLKTDDDLLPEQIACGDRVSSIWNASG